MSDGLRRLVEQLGAQLGAQAQPTPPALVGDRWLDYLRIDEIQALMVEVSRSSTGSAAPSPEVMRRAALRQALDLFHGGVDEHGVEFGGCRDCLVPGGSRCRCAEDSVLEAARPVREVDAAVVAAVRARARVQHERFARRRRERLRARVEAVPQRGGQIWPPRFGSRDRRGFGAVRALRESEALPLPGRASAGRVRVSSVARGRVTSADVEGRELARKLGVEYSVSSWKALPIVDGKRAES